MTSTDWTSQAACADRLDLPWTQDMAELHPLHTLTMAGICQGCPVLLDCLAAVDDLDITGGFWAGRDPRAAEPVPAPDWATTEPAAPEPVLCWIPRRSHGTPYGQGAFVLQSDDAGVWHLGGVAS